MKGGADLQRILDAIESGRPEPVYLVTGDRVVAEPAAVRIGEALANKAGCEPEVHRRPSGLGSLLVDLRTFSLFSSAKVVVAVESAALADLAAAADLIDDAVEILPLPPGTVDLSPRERLAAGRLLQTLSLFQIEPGAGDATGVIGALPDPVLQGGRSRRKGGRRGRSKKRVAELREHLAGLLDAALAAGLEGWAESDLIELAEIVENGLPEGHSLVLAESTVAGRHPLVQTLTTRGAVLEMGKVEVTRGGFQGLEILTEELASETGATIDPRAVQELAKRTLRIRQARGGPGQVEAESTARFAAEYRKLASMATGGRIDLALVEGVVIDRGEQDVWKILDAIGSGKVQEALVSVDRLLSTADDEMGARLSFFALLAGFARQLSAVGGMIAAGAARPGERSYPRFKSTVAPSLQGDLSGGGKNPLAGLHPFRLHRAYLAASRMPPEALQGLPSRILEVEMRLKGESGAPRVALAEFVAELAAAVR